MKKAALTIIAIAAIAFTTGCGTVDPSVITNLLTNSVPPAVSNDVPPVVVDPEPEPDVPPPDSTGLPFKLEDVNWCGKRSAPNILLWPQEWEIKNAKFVGSQVRWEGDAPSGLPRARGINNSPDRVLGFVREIGGNYYGGIGEWLKPGMSWQLWGKLTSNRIGDGGPFFDGPLATVPYRSGEPLWIVWAPYDWVGLHSGIQKRSNVERVQ